MADLHGRQLRSTPQIAFEDGWLLRPTPFGTIPPTWGRGGIGIRSGLKIRLFGLWVRVPPPLPLVGVAGSTAPIGSTALDHASKKGFLDSLIDCFLDALPNISSEVKMYAPTRIVAMINVLL